MPSRPVSWAANYTMRCASARLHRLATRLSVANHYERTTLPGVVNLHQPFLLHAAGKQLALRGVKLLADPEPSAELDLQSSNGIFLQEADRSTDRMPDVPLGPVGRVPSSAAILIHSVHHTNIVKLALYSRNNIHG